ncbi:MAG: peptidylprolyl isomerase [Oscillospiraceae bacterium]|nr:peptidylprolyl isomerase [Oscillospiraceae bacterium]
MSASREKKQRQGSQGLTQKQRQEQQEAQAKRRKMIGYTTCGVILAVLVAALLIWHSGFFQSRTTAATINGHSYTPTDVAFYYTQALNQEYMMAQYGMSTFNPQTSAREQFIDEAQTSSYFDKFMTTALEELTRITALVDAANADGFTADEEVRTYVNDSMASLDNTLPNGYNRESYLKAIYGKYMTVARYKTCLERQALANAYQSAHQDSLTYDDAALENYYTENKADLDTYQYSLSYFNGTAPNPTDENGDPKLDDQGNAVTATEEEQAAAMEAAKEDAQKLVDEVRDGGSFATLAARYESQSDGNTYTADQTARGSGLSSTYKEWLTNDSRKAGDVELFEASGGVYVVLFQDRYRNEELIGTADVRHILIKAETAESSETDSSGNPIPSQEALDAAKAEAQSLLDQWKAGDQTPESFGALANEHSDDPGSNTNGGLYENIPQGQFFSGFNDWMFDPSRQVGDTELIENPQSGQQGWHVVYFQKKGELLWKYTAANALRSNEMSEWLTGLQADYAVQQDSGIKYVDD